MEPKSHQPARAGFRLSLVEHLLEAPNPEQLYRQFVLGLTEAVPGVDQALILVKDANRYFHYLAAYGLPDELWRSLEGLPEAHLRADFPAGDTAWYRGEGYLESGYRLPGLGTVEPARHFQALLPCETSHSLTLPLLAEGQVWALLSLHGCNLGKSHLEAVHRYLEGIAGIVRQIHQHQEAKRRSLWLGAINSLLRFPREHPLETALQDALEEAIRLSEADGARLVSFEGGTVRTLAQAGWGVGLETEERRVRPLEVEAALTRTVRHKLARGEQISIPRYDLYPDHRPELAVAGLSSLLALPVQRQGSEGGALLLFKTQSHWLPDLQTRELLQDMAAAIGIVRQERLLQEELSWAAYTDPLTGLGNRRAFERDLEDLRKAPPGRVFMLALLDLDEFKAINDTYGHVHADHVLVRLGATLKAKARAGDRAYRLGGDEFALIIEGSVSLEVSRTAERYRTLVEEIKVAEGEHLRASLGFAVLPGDTGDLADLWRVADDRMYDDKALRRVLGNSSLTPLPNEARRTHPESIGPLGELAARLGRAAELTSAELQALAWACYLSEGGKNETVSLSGTLLAEAVALLGEQEDSSPARILRLCRAYLYHLSQHPSLPQTEARTKALAALGGHDPHLVELLSELVEPGETL